MRSESVRDGTCDEQNRNCTYKATPVSVSHDCVISLFKKPLALKFECSVLISPLEQQIRLVGWFGTYCVDQASLELTKIYLPQPPEDWDSLNK